MIRKRSDRNRESWWRGDGGRWIIAGILTLAMTAGAAAEEPSPALKVELVRPGEQVEGVIALFQGTRAADPASALAAWNHSRPRNASLGKATEALIAVFNTGMSRELRSLNNAQFRLVGFDPTTGQPRWRAFLPRDKGRFASVTTALALTDGGAEEPMGKIDVLRLGPVNSPLAATVDHRLILGSSRRELTRAVEEWGTQLIIADSRPSGIYLHANAARLAGSSSLLVRRLSAVFGDSEPRACLRLEGDALLLDLTTPIPQPPGAFSTIEPSWLDPIPAVGTVAAFAVALGPSTEMVSATFALFDRVEKADPSRAEVAPIRTRLNLLAALAGVRPEVDLWPRLRGVSGFLLADDQRDISGALLILHLEDAASARTLADVTIPKLLSSYAKPSKGNPSARLTLQGKSFQFETVDRDVWITWGDAARAAALSALADTARSAARELRASWRGSRPQRLGALWAGRLPRLVGSTGPKLDRALLQAPPIVWQGHLEGQSLRDQIRWEGLHETVRQVLAVLPLDPPPDH